MAIILDGTLGETFPSWTTAGRPASPAVGQMGYNTTIGQFDAYTSGGWVSVATTTSTSNAITSSQMPAGSVIQVVQTVKTDTFTSAVGSTFTDITGMSATITPSSASSRIMVQVNMFGVFWRMGQNGCILRLLKNGTNVGGGDAAGSRSSCIGTQTIGGGIGGTSPDAGMMFNYQWIDSPASTSALTYKIQFYQDTPSNPIYVNRTINDTDNVLWPRTLSTIILTEVKG